MTTTTPPAPAAGPTKRFPRPGRGRGAEAGGARSNGTAPSAARRGITGPLLIALVVLFALYGAALLVLRPASPGRPVALGDVIAAANDGQVASARFLDQDARIVGTLTGPQGDEEFWSAYPASGTTNALLDTFLSQPTEVSVDSQPAKATVRFVAQFLLPLVILANLFALLFVRVSGGGGAAGEFAAFSRLGDRKVGATQRSGITFANVAAAPEAVTELAEVRDYLADPMAFAAMGALPPKGVLLVGPPGCGKTLLARAVAGEAKASFYSISGSEFVESLVGVGAARVRDLFRQARESAPSILFIDELDAVGRQRGAGLGGGHDEREQTLNEMLVQMDGFSPTEGVAVLAATNRPDILDPALLRPGRFDRHITVERPDAAGRLEILRLHARGKRLADPEADLPEVAAHTPGFTGADLAAVINEGALLAVRERASAVTRPHLDEAVERVVAGPRRRARPISESDKRRLAYHEAGHAVVAAATGKASELSKVPVIARGRGIGHLATLVEDRAVLTSEDMEATIAVALGGLAAEELVLGGASTGSEDDLGRATSCARDMAGRYGMSARLGRMRVLREQREVFLGRDYLSNADVSQPTLEHLDVEVRRILDEQEGRARSALSDNRSALDDLAAYLEERETLQGEDLRQALSGITPLAPTATTISLSGSTPGPAAPPERVVAPRPPAPAPEPSVTSRWRRP